MANNQWSSASPAGGAQPGAPAQDQPYRPAGGMGLHSNVAGQSSMRPVAMHDPLTGLPVRPANMSAPAAPPPPARPPVSYANLLPIVIALVTPIAFVSYTLPSRIFNQATVNLARLFQALQEIVLIPIRAIFQRNLNPSTVANKVSNFLQGAGQRFADFAGLFAKPWTRISAWSSIQATAMKVRADKVMKNFKNIGKVLYAEYKATVEDFKAVVQKLSFLTTPFLNLCKKHYPQAKTLFSQEKQNLEQIISKWQGIVGAQWEKASAYLNQKTQQVEKMVTRYAEAVQTKFNQVMQPVFTLMAKGNESANKAIQKFNRKYAQPTQKFLSKAMELAKVLTNSVSVQIQKMLAPIPGMMKNLVPNWVFTSAQAAQSRFVQINAKISQWLDKKMETLDKIIRRLSLFQSKLKKVLKPFTNAVNRMLKKMHERAQYWFKKKSKKVKKAIQAIKDRIDFSPAALWNRLANFILNWISFWLMVIKSIVELFREAFAVAASR